MPSTAKFPTCVVTVHAVTHLLLSSSCCWEKWDTDKLKHLVCDYTASKWLNSSLHSGGSTFRATLIIWIGQNALFWGSCQPGREARQWSRGARIKQTQGTVEAWGQREVPQSLWSREASSDSQAGFQPQEARWWVGQKHSSCRERKSKSPHVQRHGMAWHVWWMANVPELRVWGSRRWQTRWSRARGHRAGELEYRWSPLLSEKCLRSTGCSETDSRKRTTGTCWLDGKEERSQR